MNIYAARDSCGWIALYMGKPKWGNMDWSGNWLKQLPDAFWPSLKPGECRRVMLAPRKRKARRKR